MLLTAINLLFVFVTLRITNNIWQQYNRQLVFVACEERTRRLAVTESNKGGKRRMRLKRSKKKGMIHHVILTAHLLRKSVFGSIFLVGGL